MSAEAHRRAEDLFAQGEAKDRAGDASSAALMYAEAARLEETALATVPEDRERTRSVLAESAVSLWLRAGLIEQAGAAARRFIGLHLSAGVSDYLLDVANEARWAAEATAEGRTHARTYRIALRGGTVRPGGLIPVDLLLVKLEQFRNLVVRVGEWTSGMEFRTKGAPPEGLTSALLPMVSPAMPGSYAFDLRLEGKPQQLSFFADRPVDPAAIATAFYDLVENVADMGPAGIDQQVTDDDYRTAFLRLIRNIAPSGRDLAEITVAPLDNKRTARLVPEVRRAVGHDLKSKRSTNKNEVSRRGVLRGLDLDRHHLVLREGGQEQSFQIAEDAALDDLVGPLVNHRVEVVVERLGRWHYVTDVLEADED